MKIPRDKEQINGYLEMSEKEDNGHELLLERY